MSVILHNNATTFISTSIDGAQTTIPVVSVQSFPDLTAGEYLYATLASPGGDIEIVKVTGKSGNSFSVVRGQEGTASKSFPNNSIFEARVTAASVGDKVQEVRNDLAEPDGGSLVGFSHDGNFITTVYDKLLDTVSVTDYGAVGDGVANDTQAFTDAIATGKAVYVPEGIYRVNIVLSKKCVLVGDGSTSTILKPFLDSQPVILLPFSAMYAGNNGLGSSTGLWTYHGEIRNIGFISNQSKTGTAFAYGKGSYTQYQNLDEYAMNVKFIGCFIQGFEYGLYIPFGSIGTDMYSCCLRNCKYGIYNLNNKFGGIMHAGCKYLYSVAFYNNDCAFYTHNTADGFGATILRGCIIEGNKVGFYLYSVSSFVPVQFDGVWLESNGGGELVPLDSWSGTTRSVTEYAAKTLIIEGGNARFYVNNGVAKDILVREGAKVFISNSRVESSPGFGGGAFVIEDKTNSVVELTNCTSDTGIGITPGVISNTPIVLNNNIAVGNSTRSSLRAFNTLPRGSKIQNYGASLVASEPFVSAVSLSGTASITGTVVSDGVIYNTCNEFSTLTSGRYVKSSFFTLTGNEEFYVITYDVKRVSGTLSVNIWDLSQNNFAISSIDDSGTWTSVAVVARAQPNTANIGYDFSVDASGGTAVWRVSAMQVHKFTTLSAAHAFLNSGVYAES